MRPKNSSIISETASWKCSIYKKELVERESRRNIYEVNLMFIL